MVHCLGKLSAFLVVFAGALTAAAGAPFLYEWNTGTNVVPNDAFFTIGSNTKVSARVGPTGEQIRVYQIGNDFIEPELLPADHWGEPSYGYRLSVRVDEQTIPLGNPVVVTAVLRNTSSNNFRFSAQTKERDYRFVVIDHRQQEVPLTEYGKELYNRESRWAHTSFLIPRSQCKFDIQINKIFDLRELGEYVIYAKRTIPVEDEKTPDAFFPSVVVSGNARFTIGAPSKPDNRTNSGSTAKPASTSLEGMANQSPAALVGKVPPSNPQGPTTAAELWPTATPPENGSDSAAKTPSTEPPVQLAQTGTGAGWSGRDWVYSLLVLGLLLGLGGYLFRVHTPKPSEKKGRS
jgi:hypothetical protein